MIPGWCYKTAHFAPDDQHRIWLRRELMPESPHIKPAVFILYNPSTAMRQKKTPPLGGVKRSLFLGAVLR